MVLSGFIPVPYKLHTLTLSSLVLCFCHLTRVLASPHSLHIHAFSCAKEESAVYWLKCRVSSTAPICSYELKKSIPQKTLYGNAFELKEDFRHPMALILIRNGKWHMFIRVVPMPRIFSCMTATSQYMHCTMTSIKTKSEGGYPGRSRKLCIPPKSILSREWKWLYLREMDI